MPPLQRQFCLSVIPRTRPPSIRFLNARSVHANTNARLPGSLRRTNLRRISIASGAVLGASILLVQNADDTRASIQDANKPAASRQPPPLTSMLRSYVVYFMCSIPVLVDWSPKILSTLISIPIGRDITESLVRATFFAQFVGGDTAIDTLPLLEKLRAENKGVLFAYSVEVDESQATNAAASSRSQFNSSESKQQPAHKRIVDEMISSIDVAADFEERYAHAHGTTSTSGRKTWVAIKLTALLPDAQSLTNLSSYLTRSRPHLSHKQIPFPGCARSTDLDVLNSSSMPGVTSEKVSPLTKEDVIALQELHSGLVRICNKAQERGVKVVIDAEYSWYQPAIDAFTLSLQRQFNALPPSRWRRSRAPTNSNDIQPLVLGTYQAYLRRTPAHLAYSLQDAKVNNYSLGVKLVRGAYHPHEIAAHPSFNAPTVADTSPDSRLPSISSEPDPPVWLERQDTDKCYNECARLLISEIKADIERQVQSGGPARISVLFGTHNWESCNIILKELVDRGLATEDKYDGETIIRIGTDVADRLIFGQLYGMSDALTNSLVDRTRSASPMVIKYVPYGALKDVMPYLSRRAIENKSILGEGGAVEERKRVGAAIRKRIFG